MIDEDYQNNETLGVLKIRKTGEVLTGWQEDEGDTFDPEFSGEARPGYDYTVAPDAHEDLAGNAENYELLDMDDFLPAAEQPKPMFTYPRRNAHASQQD